MLRSFSIAILWLAISSGHCSYSQEFKEHPNGLIYDELTMNSLRRIVDSENIKYRKCDPWKDHFSLPQAHCHVISLDSLNVKDAVADLERNIDFDSFCKKYQHAEVLKNLLVLKDKPYYGKEMQIEFSTVEVGKAYRRTIYCGDKALYGRKLKGSWVYRYNEKTKYSRESVTAFYFTTEFTSSKIPKKYARMIQYSDCMIDTNSAILLPNAKERYGRFGAYHGKKSKKNRERMRLAKYINRHTERPDRKQYAVDSVYEQAWASWYDRKDSIIANTVANTDEFKSLLKAAIDKALALRISDGELESLAFQFDTKEHALQLKRSVIVVGGCSQDSRPRRHAQEIAVLAAETVNWDIFLRAHLDIMNDRFQRVSDGSYAWRARNTYIKELEQLDFDVTTLLLGITLRIDNPSGNHYFGSIGRLGRALSESEHHDEIEKEMSGAIRDTQLDDFNRMLIYYLYRNYIYYLADITRKKNNIKELMIAVSTLPEEYKAYIEIKESDFLKSL